MARRTVTRELPTGGFTLLEPFSTAVQKWPNSTAIAFEAEELTYRDLASAAIGVAARLEETGVGHGDMVGILAERSIEMIVAIYGVILAGAAYVPLDPDYPLGRLRYMVQETQMSAVLSQSHMLDRFSFDVEKIDIAEVPPVSGDVIPPLIRLSEEIAPDYLAYVIYTSGSTGRPKGVAVSHRAIGNMIDWMQTRYSLGPESVFLEKNQFSFDYSVYGFFWPLQHGGRLVMARPGHHGDPAYLVQSINSYRVDTTDFVPTVLRLFLDHPAAATCKTLRIVNSCGEALTRDLQDRFYEVLPDAELHNLYGPTEAAVAMTAWRCRRGDERAIVPIGMEMSGNTVHILDSELRPVPDGKAGELFIGGAQVATGYVGRPDLTTERFIDDPFNEEGRLYRTGDLARRLEDGNLEFLGRTDHQLKIRGHRVELGEVESVLTEHPSILAAAVTVEDVANDNRLVAHVQWRNGPASDSSLRTHLLSLLPAFMMPERFVSHQALPLNSSGKIDRQKLWSTEGRQVRSAAGRDETIDPLERLLLDIWRRTLDREDLTVDDGVFELGATSLHAASFINEVQRELDEFIYVVTVFTNPTVKDFARFLSTEYPEAVSRRLGLALTPRRRELVANDELIAGVEQLVPRFGPYPAWRRGHALPRAVFILAPPRSGTTLLRVMLSGHPEVFAAPELQLLNFDTLAAKRSSLGDRFKIWNEGAVRAVMELEGCDPESALRLIEDKAAAGLTSKEFFVQLQKRAERLIVDKSTTYAFDLEVLRNAEAAFDRPVYIHLVRHPVAMIDSFERHRMDQALYLSESELPRRVIAQGLWALSHANIERFGAEVDPERFVQIRFEDLVADPPQVMGRILTAMGLMFDHGVLTPYEDVHRKMVDGLYPASAPMGDPGFLNRGGIDPGAAGDIEVLSRSNELAASVADLAGRLGYEIEGLRAVAGRRRSHTSDLRQRRQRSR